MALGTRLSGTLPVSIGAHLLVFGLLLVVPLVADMTLPSPATSLPAYLRATAVPAPPPAAAPHSRTRTAEREPTPGMQAAPFAAPTGIRPERPFAATDVPGVEGGIGSGVPVDVGVTVPALTPAVELLPPSPKSSAAIRIADLPQPPRKLVDARPAYPESARAARIAGTVVLEAVIDKSGRIDDVRVLRSVPLLDQAAVDAVRQWRYTPSTLRGQPVAVLVTITVNFTLQ